MKNTKGLYMQDKFFASFLSLILIFTGTAPLIAQENGGSGMSRSMEQAIRLYRAGETTEAMDRFMDILVKGSPSEKALANEYISKITIGMNTGVTGINDDDTDAGLAAVRKQNKTKSNAAHGISGSAESFTPEELASANSSARKDVIAKRVYKAIEDMRRNVMLQLSNLSCVKLYTKNGRLTALSMNSNYFFAGDTAFRGGTEEALSLIAGLIFTMGKVNCLILPEGSVGGDIKIKNIRRAIALNSYLENRGVSKAKIDVDLVGNDVSIPKELSNVGGLIILFDYAKEPRLKPVDDMKTKGPRVSLGVYPTAIAPHKNEGAIVEFSIMELQAGIPSWSFQIYQAQPDGSRLQLQEIHGTGAQYNQSYWNGRRNFFGIPYPAGRYIFSLTAKDVEGNETSISRYVQIQPSPQEGKAAQVSGAKTLKQKVTPPDSLENMNIEMDDSSAAKKAVKKGRAKKSSKKSGKKKVTNRSKKAAASAGDESSPAASTSHKVYFRENTANATPSGEKKISEIADEMTVDPAVTVTITGYASTSEPEPQALAESRSNYIADKFVEEYSIDASRIETRTSVSDTPQSIANVEISKK